MHSRRIWSLAEVTAEEAAEKLTTHDWTMCSGWRIRDTKLALLNDSTSPDALQEYSIVRIETETPEAIRGQQLDSLTVSWCNEEEILKYIGKYAKETSEVFYGPVTANLHLPTQSCGACA